MIALLIDTPNLATKPLLYYDSVSSKWINTDSLKDNILFVKDDVDGTEKLKFEISGISASTTRTLTIPDYNCYLLGTSNLGSSGTTGYTCVCSFERFETL